MPAAKVIFGTKNLTQTIASTVKGVNFVEGRTIRGPVGDPSIIFNSWPGFVKVHGGLTNDSDAPRLVKRILENGGSIRFNRVAHYTDVTDAETLTALKAGPIIISDAPVDGTPPTEPLFQLVPKYPGADYNNVTVKVAAGSNNQPGYFDLTISHATDPTLLEEYRNLFIEGKPTASKSTYLKSVIEGSGLVDVTYSDLSILTDPAAVPIDIETAFAGGVDGDPADAVDYIGDSNSRTGFHAFDEYDDAMQLGVLDFDDDTIHIAGAAYATNRKDLIYQISLSNDLTTKTALIDKRESLTIDTKFVEFVGGGIKILDLLTGQILPSSNLADLMILCNKTSQNYGEYYSHAGNTRGLVNNSLGVVNNFGSPATSKDLDNLIDAGINMFINRDGQIKLWGNRSGQYAYDQERFTSIVRLVIFIKKSLRPTLEDFLEEPNDIPTWKRMYYTVKPFMDSLVTKRALYSYEWQGDQFSKGLNGLTINDATDVTNGKYVVRIVLKAIGSIQEINVDMILTPGGISFETANELI